METLLTSLMDDKDDTPSSNLDFAAPPYVPRQGASPLGGDVVPRSTGSSGDLLRAPPRNTHVLARNFTKVHCTFAKSRRAPRD